MKKIYIQVSTHWDREWYVPFERFRYELVNVVDEVIEELTLDKNLKCFIFDGQSIIVEDYLEVMSQNEEKLRTFIGESKLKIGPMYIAPDELLVSGESIIQNFLKCKEICNKYNTVPYNFGYVNDQFGHIAQFPQILNKLGIKMVYLGRGLGSEKHNLNYFIWKAPDGSECFGYKSKYSDFYINYKKYIQSEERDENQKDEFVREYINEQFKRSETDAILLNITGDHAHVKDCMIDALKRVKKIANEEGIEVIESGFNKAFDDIEMYRDRLQTIEGELIETAEKDSFKVVTDSISSYYTLKYENDLCQKLLENVISPIIAYAMIKNKPIKKEFLKVAYTSLLQNHPHDSICGCSAQQVHKDMEYRFDRVKSISDSIITDFTCRIRNDNTSEAENYILSIFNPAPYRRKQVITVDLEFDNTFPKKFPGNAPTQPRNMFKIFDANQNEIEYQIIGIKRGTYDLKGITVKNYHTVDIYTVAFETELNGFAQTELMVVPTDEIIRQRHFMKSGDTWAENDYVRIEIQSDGTFTLYDKITGKKYPKLHYFIDDADAGNGWWHEDAENEASAITSRLTDCSVEKTKSGNVLTTFKITKKMMLPESLDYNLHSRSTLRKEQKIISLITLKKDSGRIYIQTEIENVVKDHRIRLMLPTNIDGKTYVAGQAFYFCERDKGSNERTLSWIEPERVEKHFNGIIYKTDEDNNGLAFVGDAGFHQAGVLDDEENTISVVMFRSFGRNHLQNPSELSQLQKKLTFNYTITPMNSKISKSELHRDSIYDFHKEISVMYHSDEKPRIINDNITINSEHVCVSTIKPAENDSGAFIIRLFNTYSNDTMAKISFSEFMAYVCETDLYENPCGISQNNIKSSEFLMKPYEIKTVIVKPKFYNK